MKRIQLKKILIALDFDPAAQKVAESGFAIAKSMGAEIVLLHVVSAPINYASKSKFTIMGFAGHADLEPLHFENQEGLVKVSQLFLEKARQHLGDEAIQVIVKEGDAAETILKVVKLSHIDIIVIGSHSSKKSENVLMGNVTKTVLHNSAVPILIIPTKKIN